MILTYFYLIIVLIAKIVSIMPPKIKDLFPSLLLILFPIYAPALEFTNVITPIIILDVIIFILKKKMKPLLLRHLCSLQWQEGTFF